MRGLKIATWNLERLKHKKQLDQIVESINSIDADVLVLTETDDRVVLNNFPYKIQTVNTHVLDPLNYKTTETRVAIYSKYKIVRTLKTCDPFTCCCAELETPFGNLMVYGTIIGVYGNRHKNFKEDLALQLIDFQNFSLTENLCIAGDFNISFADNYYFTNEGRNKLDQSFELNSINLLTRNVGSCIDHVAVAKNYLKNMKCEVSEWNMDKTLSDHKGVLVKFSN